MWYYWVLFIFLAFISKALLAFGMIYFLLPNDRFCSQCDEDTLLIRSSFLGRIGYTLTWGRMEWRWCPRCGWEGLARRGKFDEMPRAVDRIRQETRSGH